MHQSKDFPSPTYIALVAAVLFFRRKPILDKRLHLAPSAEHLTPST